jgi:hypothetical protein
MTRVEEAGTSVQIIQQSDGNSKKLLRITEASKQHISKKFSTSQNNPSQKNLILDSTVTLRCTHWYNVADPDPGSGGFSAPGPGNQQDKHAETATL